MFASADDSWRDTPEKGTTETGTNALGDGSPIQKCQEREFPIAASAGRDTSQTPRETL